MQDAAHVPMKSVGPVRISGPEVEAEVCVPLATYESPLWPSVARGAKVTAAAGGIRAVVLDERMARSILLEAPDAAGAAAVASQLAARRADVAAAAQRGSRFARFLDLHTQVCGSLLFVRIEITTGDAAGHNMVTRAAQQVLDWMTAEFPSLTAVSVSGNYCTDKKVSAVNGILGRGRSVVADVTIPGDLCRKLLRAEPAAIAALNVKKNLVGSILAGGVRSANAHYANMLLAFYLATGQDAANLVEGSQGVTMAEARGDALYFSVSLPNLVVGTVGAGKDLPFVRENLQSLGCLEAREPGANARRLAIIAAATVLCGELSLMAALANPGELVRVHERMERGR
ncbi:MAG: hydroxymethylglutaryl-CoA reductase [Verrucomicrobia bacterium A1]|nr:MAG: hydroxymethylglutaryl-CoA reductase [Verrucomicrobia bacterium A1]